MRAGFDPAEYKSVLVLVGRDSLGDGDKGEFWLEQRLPNLGWGLYIAVDAEGRVAYVGKVTRPHDGGFRDRYRNHHVETARWESVWVVPIHRTLTVAEVEEIEATVISFLAPYQNTQHHRRSDYLGYLS